MIQRERIKLLNRKEIKTGKYVLYWMQASQRTEYNHALEYAILRANESNQPLVAFFGITDHFPEANERHYLFMLEGLRETQSSLGKRGIKMVVLHQSPEKGVVQLSKEASLVVVDRGYLGIQRQWREEAAKRMECPLIQVESDVIIPIEEASPQEEFSAATLRPKILRKLKDFLIPVKEHLPRRDSLATDFESFSLEDLEKALASLKIDRSVARTRQFRGGTKEAKKRLSNFIEDKLDNYAELRNDPTVDWLSNLSPYLHFGQISPLHVALQISKTSSPGKEAFLEELMIRRELGMNFVFYNQAYDCFDGLPGWAKKTLLGHRKDPRQYVYALQEWEQGKTHDPYWNAAQKEMTIRGKMHGYMRMYWGKKILEWTESPEEALRIALYLNNKYELDGRDPNGFAGAAWCFGKHDRPWGERTIFGNIRYMNDKGLKRKFDADGYVRKISKLSKDA